MCGRYDVGNYFFKVICRDMKNMVVRIYSDRTEDVKIDELNKLLENGEWYIRDVIMYENCADYVLEENNV